VVATAVSTCQAPGSYTIRGGDPTLAADTPSAGDAGVSGTTGGTAKGASTPPSPTVAGNSGSTGGQAAAATTGGSGCGLVAGSPSADPASFLAVLAVLGLAIVRRRRQF